MKIFGKLLTAAVFLALASPVLLKDQEGKALITHLNISTIELSGFRDSLPSFELPDFGSGTATIEPASDASTTSNTDVQKSDQWISWSSDSNDDSMVKTSDTEQLFYRWKDNSGTWQFGRSPHPKYESHMVRIDPNMNILQSLKQEEPEVAAVEEEKKEDDSILPSPTTVPIQEIPKLIEDAKGIQQLVDDRAQKMRDLGL